VRRPVYAFVVLLIIFGILTGCGGKDSDISKNKKMLIAAMELGHPPFEMTNSEGEPSGVGVDFVVALGEYIGKEVQVVNTARDSLVTSLQTSKADIVVTSVAIAGERAGDVDYSIPYANSFLAILANKASSVKSVGDINMPGRKVAVISGSPGQGFAEENLRSAEIVALPDESACVADVALGAVDGFLCDQLAVYRNYRNNPGVTAVVSIPVQDPEYWCVAVKRGNTELLKDINNFIGEFLADGGFDALTVKYLNEEKIAFDEYGFKWFFDLVPCNT